MADTATTTVASIATARNSVLVRMAERYGVDPNKLYATLKATAFKGEVSNEQFLALMIVADQYKLNPLLREVYAFPDRNNGIVPVVGVDGWLRILNEHPQFDGLEFTDGPVNKEGLPEWIECKVFRKDRSHATVAREYLAECKRDTGPWRSHPRRLLRHKSLIQAARMAMAFVGIYDDDEAQRIIEGGVTLVPESSETVSKLNAEITGGQVIDADPEPPAPDAPAPTYAAVADALNAAKDGDSYNAAVDLIRAITDAKQRNELQELAKVARKRIEQE